MFPFKINFSVTVLFGLSTFVILTNCCSSQFNKNIKWDFVFCNDRRHDIIIETAESNNSNNPDILTRIPQNNPNIMQINKNFTINLLSKDSKHNEFKNLRIKGHTRPLNELKLISETHGKKCSLYFDLLYCLNGGRCFSYDIGESSIVSCECAEGYYGERCDFKYTLYDKTHMSNTASIPTDISNKCNPDFDLLFCLNGGKCFKYAIGDTSILWCLCAEGYYGERCDFKYSYEDGVITHAYYQNNYPNSHIIRKAKVYLTPFVIGLVITILLYIIVSGILLDQFYHQKHEKKYYYHRTKYKIFNFHKIKCFTYFLIRKE